VTDNIGVLTERLKSVEREIIELKREHREHRDKIDEKFEKVNIKIDDVEDDIGQMSTFNEKLDVMFQHLLKSHDEMKADIGKIADKVEKEQGWRGIMIDVLKLAAVIITFVATGKWFL
jgi:chromosome segregation ATPase